MKGPWESIAAGREKGFKTQKLEKPVRHMAVRELIGEVAGLLPYEKHLMDILKVLELMNDMIEQAGGNNTEKKMYKFAKKRVSYVTKD